MNKFNSQKGFAVPVLVVIALLIIGGIWFSGRRASYDPVKTSTIRLVSPNGGETLTIGATTTISFVTRGNVKDNYRVVIWLDEGSAPLVTIPATQTTHSFVVPENVLIGGDAISPLQPGSYKFRATLYDGEPCIGFCAPSETMELGSDISDGEVMIATSTQITN